MLGSASTMATCGWSTAASTSGEAKQAQSTQVENY
jgi:hypothetical protein